MIYFPIYLLEGYVGMNTKTKGILYVITAAFGFSMMSVFVHLSGDLPPFQKAFFRNLAAFIVVTVIMVKNKISPMPKKGSIPSLFCRSLFGTIGLVCNFYAIDRLVLADANMLNKLSPFFAIIFSVFLLNEKPTIVQIVGVLTAFVGSMFIIKPSASGYASFPALIGAIGGLGAGAAYTFVRRLGKKRRKQLFDNILFFGIFVLGVSAFYDTESGSDEHEKLCMPCMRRNKCVHRTVRHNESVYMRTGERNIRVRLYAGDFCRNIRVFHIQSDSGRIERIGICLDMRSGNCNVFLQ